MKIIPTTSSPSRLTWRHAALFMLLLVAPMLVLSPAIAQAPPGNVGSVTVTRADGTVTAAWPAVAGATRYHVTYSSDNTKSWTSAADSHTENQHHHQRRQRQDLYRRRARRQRRRPVERLGQLARHRAPGLGAAGRPLAGWPPPLTTATASPCPGTTPTMPPSPVTSTRSTTTTPAPAICRAGASGPPSPAAMPLPRPTPSPA